MSERDIREELFRAGLLRVKTFCEVNSLPMPAVNRLATTDRLYALATCAFYRKDRGISIMVEKCAYRGHGGASWSWPAYVIDRTPYGVLAHELGHHVDEHFSRVVDGKIERHFSREIYEQSMEPPLTGYLGNYGERQALHFFMEWFAEIFRLYVTNPDLCYRVRPKFHRALKAAGVVPVASCDWETVLQLHEAPSRIIEQARKKVAAEAHWLEGDLPFGVPLT